MAGAEEKDIFPVGSFTKRKQKENWVSGQNWTPPPVLHRTFGLTGGNIFHGAMTLDQVFLTRPVADAEGRWGVAPATPIKGLYLCGSGAHPGGGGQIHSILLPAR